MAAKHVIPPPKKQAHVRHVVSPPTVASPGRRLSPAGPPPPKVSGAPKIFLSHKTGDQALASAFKDALTEIGMGEDEVFLAEEISPGVAWARGDRGSVARQ